MKTKVKEILKVITKYTKKKWHKLALYFAFCKNVISYKFYLDLGNGYINGFNLGYDKLTLRKLYFSISDIFTEEKEKLPKDMWGILTLEATADGKINFDYNVDDITETFPEHDQKWSEQYENSNQLKNENKIKEKKMGLLNIFKKKQFKETDIEKIMKADQQMTQKVVTILQEYLPNDWQEVVFYAGFYQDDCGYFKYFIKLANGKYIDCFTLIPEPEAGKKDILQEQLMKLNNEIKSFRTRLPEKHKWVCMVITFTSEGKFDKDYDYADGIKEDDLQAYVATYKNKLNAKYLK